MKFSVSAVAVALLGVASAVPTAIVQSNPLEAAIVEREDSIAAAAACPVSFTLYFTHSYNFKIVGSVPQLGNWNVAAAPLLEGIAQNTRYPWHRLDLTLQTGTTVKFNFARLEADGGVTWNKAGEQTYTVPNDCSSLINVATQWIY